MGRILSLDVGKKRVGVAVSDPLKLIAQPFTTLNVSSRQKLIRDVLDIIKKQDVEMVVVGYPLREDGREGESALLARRIHTLLKEQAVVSQLWDESDSSREAEDVIHGHGKHRREYRDKIDQIAAAVILRRYLDALQ
jgi:putative Holliday junction resolvase